jgi:hypothetical protein
MDSKEMVQIEINGIKMEVDMRHAKRIEELRIGDRVKLLIENPYSSPKHKVHPGIIIGFEPFTTLPTIIVAYIDKNYSAVDMKFAYINKSSVDVEMIRSVDDDGLDVDKAQITELFNRQIEVKREELKAIEAKRDYFLNEFRSYWPKTERVDLAALTKGDVDG